MPGEKLLKVPGPGGLAERLNLSKSMAYELVQTRQIRSISIGKAKRVPESELDRFIADRLAEGDRLAEDETR